MCWIVLFVCCLAPASLATNSSAFDLSGHYDQIEIWQAFRFDFPDADIEPETFPLMTMVPLRSEVKRPLRISRVDRFAENYNVLPSVSLYTPNLTYPPAPLVNDGSLDSTAPSKWMSEPVVNIVLGMALISLSGLLKKKGFRVRPRLPIRAYDNLSN
jgi:hypothetical protein